MPPPTPQPQHFAAACAKLGSFLQIGSRRLARQGSSFFQIPQRPARRRNWLRSYKTSHTASPAKGVRFFSLLTAPPAARNWLRSVNFAYPPLNWVRSFNFAKPAPAPHTCANPTQTPYAMLKA